MAKKEVKNNKDKKNFSKSFKAELKKVSWPTPKQLVNNTVAVLVIVIITSVIVFALDFVFKTINTQGINKIKEVVSNSSVNETTNEVSEDEAVETETTNSEANAEVVENQENTETVDAQ